jgi:anti-sigma regulatory factor (Ser/Thr protein kinase)
MKMMSRCDTALSLEVPVSPVAPRIARAAIDELGHPLDEKAAEDARLLISELVTNSIRHAGLKEGDTVSIHMRIKDHMLRVEVSDRGRGFVGALRGRRDSAPGAGWGLSILERVAERWGMSREDGTSVWFEIDQVCPDHS